MGLDELTPMGPASIYEASGGAVTSHGIEPLDRGLPGCDLKALAGRDAATKSRVLRGGVGGGRDGGASAVDL